jgi:broad specificity phosphatase PhoE
MEKRRILLVRHCEVASRYRQLCYGRSNVELSELGLAQSEEVARQLAREPITHVYHSGLYRARHLAEALRKLVGISVEESHLLRERDFGEWELQTWDALYAATGDAMLGMLSDPAVWRPPAGETTFEMRDRIMTWYQDLPDAGVIVAVSHGGPIAALLGTLSGRPVVEWPVLIPPTGTVVEIGESGIQAPHQAE